jgi:hypothetical protein
VEYDGIIQNKMGTWEHNNPKIWCLEERVWLQLVQLDLEREFENFEKSEN